jgi:hypothetical protein
MGTNRESPDERRIWSLLWEAFAWTLASLTLATVWLVSASSRPVTSVVCLVGLVVTEAFGWPAFLRCHRAWRAMSDD